MSLARYLSTIESKLYPQTEKTATGLQIPPPQPGTVAAIRKLSPGFKVPAGWDELDAQEHLMKLEGKKTAAPIFPEQKKTDTGEKRDVPQKVIEIANAIRRDDPDVTDEGAYRIAWARYRGQKPKEHKGDWEEYHGGRADPTHVRAKLRAMGPRARKGPKEGEKRADEAPPYVSAITPGMRIAPPVGAGLGALGGGFLGAAGGERAGARLGGLIGPKARIVGGALGGVLGGSAGILGGIPIGAIVAGKATGWDNPAAKAQHLEEVAKDFSNMLMMDDSLRQEGRPPVYTEADRAAMRQQIEELMAARSRFLPSANKVSSIARGFLSAWQAAEAPLQKEAGLSVVSDVSEGIADGLVRLAQLSRKSEVPLDRMMEILATSEVVANPDAARKLTKGRVLTRRPHPEGHEGAPITRLRALVAQCSPKDKAALLKFLREEAREPEHAHPPSHPLYPRHGRSVQGGHEPGDVWRRSGLQGSTRGWGKVPGQVPGLGEAQEP